MHQVSYLKKNSIKIYNKIYIKTAPTCIGVQLHHITFFYHIRTVQHLDIIKVLFIHQLMHQ